MRLTNLTQTRRSISLTPLIDVVFLLLVFFMLASTFMKFAAVPIAATGSGGPINPDIQARISLIHVGTKGRLTVNGVPVSPERLEEQLRQQHATGNKRAIIAIRPGATVADLTRTLTIVRRVPFTKIQVVD